jgi:hypothetical protein
VSSPCPFCDRDCEACGYPIDGGWEHETRHFTNVLTCTVRRVTRPLVEIVPLFFAHAQHRSTKETAE